MSVALWLKPLDPRQTFTVRIRGKQLISSFLISVGSALLLFVSISYLCMYEHQRSLISDFQSQNGQPSISTNDLGLTRLTIPRIHLDLVISEGTSAHSLALGPGHLTHTAIPGEVGNAVIAAHRDTYFRHIASLKNGDEIFIERNGRRYRYVVTGRKIVDPGDLSVLGNSSDSRLTLITCYPVHYFGPAPKRLIIIAKQVQSV